RLLAQERLDAHAVCTECLRRVRVADLRDRTADDRFGVDIGVGRDLTRQYDIAVLDEHFTCDVCGRILREMRIEDAVGDVVGYLVGMTFGDALRGKNEAVAV